METGSKAGYRFLPLQAIPCQLSGTALLLPVTGFPVPEEQLEVIRKFLREFCSLAAKTWKLLPQVFIQVARIHIGDGSLRVSSNGSKWKPKLGLGVWPDRKPPANWTMEEFLELGPDESPRILMYSVFRVSTSQETIENAREVMLGLGTILQVLSTEGTEALLTKGREVLFPPIKDPSFRCFPYYIPLLDRASLMAASAEQMERWLCGSSVYIRESVEDTGILIASKEPLSPILEKLGAHFENEGGKAEWRIPC